MVALLTLQVLSIIATSFTNLICIITFSTDYWSVIVYDFVKLKSYAKYIIIEETINGGIYVINNTNDTQALLNLNSKPSTVVLEIEKNLLLFSTHKGIFRRCNYLSNNIRSYLKISKCRAIKTVNNEYDDYVHGLTNHGREYIRLHNVAASCTILIGLLLCVCTLIGITLGILNGVVLATMTVGILYLVSAIFGSFVVTIMYAILNNERKQTNCLALAKLAEICSAYSIQSSYSFTLGYVLIIFCLITSVLWLILQEKQRKFVQH